MRTAAFPPGGVFVNPTLDLVPLLVQLPNLPTALGRGEVKALPLPQDGPCPLFSSLGVGKQNRC